MPNTRAYPVPQAPQPWQLFTAYNSKARRWPGALRAALAILLPGTVALLLGHSEAIVLICAGGMAVIYGEGHPYRSRLRILLIAGSLLVTSFAVGALLSEIIFAPGHGHWWLLLSALYTLVLAIAGGFVQNALRLPPPGTFFMVMVGGGATMLARSGIDVVQALLWSAVGACTAVVVGMAPMLVNRHGPEAGMVAAVERAAAEFAVATEDQLSKHHQAQTDLAAAWQALSDAKVISGGRIISHSESQADLVRRTLAAQGQIVARNHQLDLGVDSDSLADAPVDVDPERTGIPHTRSTVAYRLYRAFVRDSHATVTAQKIFLAIAITAVISIALGLDRPDWGAVSVFLLLQWGPGKIAGSVRGVQRMIGSLAGVGLFAVFHILDLHAWSLLLALAACQFCAEIFVAKNYALCVVFSTPLALLMGGASAQGLGEVMGARVIEISLSVAIALAVLWLWGRGQAWRNHLRIQRRCVESMATLLGLLMWETPRQVLSQRRDLQYELLAERRSVQELAVDDQRSALQFWDRHIEIQHSGYALLDFCVLHPDRIPSEAERKELAAIVQQAQ